MPGDVEGPEDVFSDDDWYDVVDDQERDKRIADEARARKEARVNRLADKVNRSRPRRTSSVQSNGSEKDKGNDAPTGAGKDKRKEGPGKDKRKEPTTPADKELEAIGNVVEGKPEQAPENEFGQGYYERGYCEADLSGVPA